MPGFKRQSIVRLFREMRAFLNIEAGIMHGEIPRPDGKSVGSAEVHKPEDEQERYGLHLGSGDRHYRAWVGPPEDYDLISALQVSLLFAAGLKETHRLADVGCGSLRVGRMLIPYLRPGRYHGIEPERWLVEEGLEKELGRGILEVKQPKFRFVSDFSLEGFGTKFDYVVAQSVFSHTHPDLLRLGLSKISDSLAPDGKLLATWQEGRSKTEGSGWIRKGVRPYTWEEMENFACECDLRVRRLDWPHPRQSWFIGVPARADSEAEATIDRLSRNLRSPQPGWAKGHGKKRRSRNWKKAKQAPQE